MQSTKNLGWQLVGPPRTTSEENVNGDSANLHDWGADANGPPVKITGKLACQASHLNRSRALFSAKYLMLAKDVCGWKSVFRNDKGCIDQISTLVNLRVQAHLKASFDSVDRGVLWPRFTEGCGPEIHFTFPNSMRTAKAEFVLTATVHFSSQPEVMFARVANSHHCLSTL